MKKKPNISNEQDFPTLGAKPKKLETKSKPKKKEITIPDQQQILPVETAPIEESGINLSSDLSEFGTVGE